LLEAARSIVERIWEIAGQTRSAALAALSQDEREQLVELLERVHGTLLALETK
jgi:DNA-binding MarR family transcriptional regulator